MLGQFIICMKVSAIQIAKLLTKLDALHTVSIANYLLLQTKYLATGGQGLYDEP